MTNPLPLEIDVHTASEILSSTADVFLLDCRQPAEHATANIAGAVLIPMHELVERAQELESYRETRIIVHCHLGGRSLQVAQWLRQQGYAQSQSMAGGIDAWSQRIDPRIPRY